MGIFISFLVVIHVIVCLLLVLLVLMQRPKQEGLGAAFGGGMTDQMFGAQTTDVLQKATVWLTVAFFVISMLLAILVANRNDQSGGLTESLSEGGAAPVETKTEGLPSLPKPPEGLTPAVPVEPAKATTPATSSERPNRPIGTSFSNSAKSSALACRAVVSAVSIGPGHTALMRIFSRA